MPAVAIIQARMTSTRLPGKVMADLAGKPMIERMVERVSKSSSLAAVVIATTGNREDDPVAELAGRLKVRLSRGDEHDVLGRIQAAASAAGADPVVRLTADCPMSDPAVIDAALELFASSGADYVSNCNRRTFPDGFDVEVMSAKALATAHREARHPLLREHVTPYIRGNRPDLGCGDFRRADLLADADFGHLRFTVDTEDDLKFIRSIFARLPDGFGWLDAVALATRDPGQLRVTDPPAELAGLALRPVGQDDAAALFRWLNEAERQTVSLKTQCAVHWSDHVAWLDRRLSDPDAWLAVASYDGIVAGQVRIQLEPEGLAVSIYVDAMFRGRNVGRFLIDGARIEARRRWPGVAMIARVRHDNPQSAVFFRAAGFLESERHADHLVLREKV